MKSILCSGLVFLAVSSLTAADSALTAPLSPTSDRTTTSGASESETGYQPDVVLLDGQVKVEIMEGIPDRASWSIKLPEPTESFAQSAFGFVRVPAKYTPKGIKADRSNPFVIRASARVQLPPGEPRILLRARNGSRLFMDGKEILNTRFPELNSDGHEEVPEAPALLIPDLRYLPAGHFEAVTNIASSGGQHVFILEAMAGGKGRRPELGELSVSVATGDEMFRLMAPVTIPGKAKSNAVGPLVPLTDEGWTKYATEREAQLARLDASRRYEGAAKENAYWAQRHHLARVYLATRPAPSIPEVPSEFGNETPIDRFIGHRLAAAEVQPAPVVNDWAFLRRLSLDVIGIPPSPDDIEMFCRDQSAARRGNAIERSLRHPRWADQWLPYWQDVLAENPGIVKPMLNNTGPFRWFIHESFLDNKPIDRFVTELVMMEGSTYYGGPAGFGLATENDVPMAAKAQIVAQAFLGLQLQCARCHDAPYHNFKQRDLFSLAAMLKKGPQPVPLSSSIPTNSNIVLGRLVSVTLEPGTKVEPHWPFDHLVPGELPPGVLRRPDDSREQLAALLTSPANERFAQVIVNRLWKRYLGWGIVEPVDDWENAQPSHPGLLRYLAHELATHDYDLKHVARLILSSRTYQRQVRADGSREGKPDQRLFAAAARRRLAAEQIVDSLFAIAGKPFRSEEMNLDVDGRRPVKDFNNLGTPYHAWQFASLSNERDRPALAMPQAQNIVDTLSTFGWRESRQNPLTVRDDSPNVLQPATLANGLMSARIARLSDDSALTVLALQDQSLTQLIEGVFLRLLSRPPSPQERKLFTSLLDYGYAERVLPPSRSAAHAKAGPRRPVSWSNHLSPEATRIKQELERESRAGDPPTERLRTDWRERMEDVVWTLINSPEFVFIP